MMIELAIAETGTQGSAESRIRALLESDAIDLAGISAAIRERPGLQRLVLTMSESLALAPPRPERTVEEAAVVLGKNRLRVLVQAWSVMHGGGRASIADGARAGKVTPEVLYLSSFFRWLGLDSGNGSREQKPAACEAAFDGGEEVAGLTDLLMRDIVSLIPYVDPILPEHQLNAGTAAAAARSREESAE